MNVFAESDFTEFLTRLEQSLGQTIRNESDDYILNVDEDEYVEHLVDSFSVDPPVIRRDLVQVDSREQMISAERFPRGFDTRRGGSYPRQALTFFVPVEGNIDLVRYSPSFRLMWTQEVEVRGDALTFDVIVWSEETEQIKRETDRVLNNLEQQANNLKGQAETFNQGLRDKARGALQARRELLLKQASLVESLGVPLRKRTDLPRTFAVPPPAKRKRIVVKPDVSTTTPALDPTLSETVYREVLQTIWDLGRTMERLPSTYADRDEETLRDHILLYLTPRFEGTSTGETFNKDGKTDILLRFEASNVFIAECKFWSGAKALLTALDQLLSYLTWRAPRLPLCCSCGTRTSRQFSKRSWRLFRRTVSSCDTCVMWTSPGSSIG